jgi:hypothetical protein
LELPDCTPCFGSQFIVNPPLVITALRQRLLGFSFSLVVTEKRVWDAIEHILSVVQKKGNLLGFTGAMEQL